mgnify:CR=1 FL=1
MSDQQIKDEFERQVKTLRGDWKWYGPQYLRSDDGRIMLFEPERYRGHDDAAVTRLIAAEIEHQKRASSCAYF